MRHALQCTQASVSQASLLSLMACLQEIPINRAAFRLAHSEWKKHAVDSRMSVGQLNDLECPACVPGERALHGDGNQKLFNWSRSREALRLPYYNGVLFAPSADVQGDMKAVDAMLGTEVRCLAREGSVAHTEASGRAQLSACD